ncbi:MAG: DNA/RNA nuclease SfsA [Lachnospiraceae bacterium]|nr:DNA/RNA nuclease SfsA [Lachnospiraceae bacterium]
MRYKNIVTGRFLERPNRFIAYVEIEGKKAKVHVKNTGRCRELLVPGTEVYLEKSDNESRSTAYDLVAVVKNGRIVNMDSNAPNKVVEEWLIKKEFFTDLTLLRPETMYQNSRFDFYMECGKRKAFIEVKGVTLENDNVVRFPDAPSERAVKHVKELINAKKEGYDAYIIFVIQMEGVSFFEPNEQTQPEFAEVLREARRAGVCIKAFDCKVTEESMEIHEEVPVVLSVLDKISTPLLAWYDRQHRILPWREEPTGYRVWVSEIMLQQTRVEAVKPYYERFLNFLPDIASLAGANEEVLLKLWEGLGYYNRVRNMQKAAKVIMEEYGGSMPEEYGELLRLPGIGSYTAGAVSSIAYGRKVPAVDGNVLRVISRLRMDDADILSDKVKKGVEQDLLDAMSTERPGDFNQAMMELGAVVCVPNGMAKCGECPLNEICQAYKEDRVLEFPVKAKKKPRTIEKKTILIIKDENRVAIHKRPNRGLLAGLYEFPSLEGHKSKVQVIKALKEWGLNPIFIQELESSKHIFSHKEWHMKGYAIRVDELMPVDGKEQGLLFVEPDETEERYPIPSAFVAYTKYLNIKLGNEKFKKEN